MDILQQCAMNFDRLANYSYRIIVGRKGVTREFLITFNRSEFHHLAGLHKLKSNLVFTKDSRLSVFTKLVSGDLSLIQIQHEAEYPLIKNRIKNLVKLEEFLDSNELVFRFDYRRAYPTAIRADFLMQNELDGETVYLFLAKRRENESYVCKSFFQKSGKDYAKGQERFALLYKEKTNVVTGETVVQYDKLTPKS